MWMVNHQWSILAEISVFEIMMFLYDATENPHQPPAVNLSTDIRTKQQTFYQTCLTCTHENRQTPFALKRVTNCWPSAQSDRRTAARPISPKWRLYRKLNQLFFSWRFFAYAAIKLGTIMHTISTCMLKKLIIYNTIQYMMYISNARPQFN